MPILLQHRSPALDKSDFPTLSARRLIHIYCSGPGSSPGLPLICRASQAAAVSLNSTFAYHLFDRPKMETFVESEFPEYLRVFHSFPYVIQQFDFFRYLAVYRLGGIYLDLDVFLAEDLEPLVSLPCVFPFEELTLNLHLRRNLGIDWELGNYAFGAQAGHPFIKAVIDNCVKGQQEPGWAEEMLRGIPRAFQEPFYVTNSTGPGLVTRTLAENPELQSGVTVLFPENVCDEATWHRFGDFGVHLMNAGWRKPKSFLRTQFTRFWEKRLRRRLLAESMHLGPKRNGAWRIYVRNS